MSIEQLDTVKEVIEEKVEAVIESKQEDIKENVEEVAKKVDEVADKVCDEIEKVIIGRVGTMGLVNEPVVSKAVEVIDAALVGVAVSCGCLGWKFSVEKTSRK